MAIYDPRVWRKFLELSEGLNVSFRVPKDLSPEELRNCDSILVDVQALAILARRGADLNTMCREVLVVSSEENLLSPLLKFAGFTDVSRLTAGIDIGGSMAYVVLADGTYLTSGKSHEVRKVVGVLSKVREALRPLNSIVKVGVPHSEELLHLFKALTDSLLAEGFEVYLIDEFNTTLKPFPRIRGVPKKLKDKDLRAAINIALREGIKLVK